MNKIENELLELLCEIGNPDLAIKIKQKITEYRDSEAKSALSDVISSLKKENKELKEQINIMGSYGDD